MLPPIENLKKKSNSNGLPSIDELKKKTNSQEGPQSEVNLEKLSGSFSRDEWDQASAQYKEDESGIDKDGNIISPPTMEASNQERIKINKVLSTKKSEDKLAKTEYQNDIDAIDLDKLASKEKETFNPLLYEAPKMGEVPNWAQDELVLPSETNQVNDKTEPEKVESEKKKVHKGRYESLSDNYEGYKPIDESLHKSVVEKEAQLSSVLDQIKRIQTKMNEKVDYSPDGLVVTETKNGFNSLSDDEKRSKIQELKDLENKANEIKKYIVTQRKKTGDKYLGLTEDERKRAIKEEALSIEYGNQQTKALNALGINKKHGIEKLEITTADAKKLEQVMDEFQKFQDTQLKKDFDYFYNNVGKSNKELLTEYLNKELWPKFKAKFKGYDPEQLWGLMKAGGRLGDEEFNGALKADASYKKTDADEIQKELKSMLALMTWVNYGGDDPKAYFEEKGYSDLPDSLWQGFYKGATQIGDTFGLLDKQMSKARIDLVTSDQTDIGANLVYILQENGMEVSDSIKEMSEHSRAEKFNDAIEFVGEIIPEMAITRTGMATAGAFAEGLTAGRASQMLSRLKTIAETGDNKLQRVLAKTTLKGVDYGYSGAEYQLTGMLFGDEQTKEELTFGSGIAGAAGTDIGNVIINGLTKNPYLKALEKPAVDAMAKFFTRGIGEDFEETAQTLWQIYDNSNPDDWGEIKEQFTGDNLVDFYLITHTMGTAMAGGHTPVSKEQGGKILDWVDENKQRLTKEDQEKFNQATGLNEIGEAITVEQTSEGTLKDIIEKDELLGQEESTTTQEGGSEVQATEEQGAETESLQVSSESEPELQESSEGVQSELGRELEEDLTPAQIAEKYIQERDYLESKSPSEVAISKHIGSGVSLKSVEQQGDKNTFNNSMMRSYVREDGRSIDQVAQDASYQINPEGDGTEVSPQDVIDFMANHPQGASSLQAPAGNTKLKELKDKYYEQTGKRIDKKVAESLINKSVKENEVDANKYLEQYTSIDGEVDYKAIIDDPKGYQFLTGLSDEQTEQVVNKAVQYETQKVVDQYTNEDGSFDLENFENDLTPLSWDNSIHPQVIENLKSHAKEVHKASGIHSESTDGSVRGGHAERSEGNIRENETRGEQSSTETQGRQLIEFEHAGTIKKGTFVKEEDGLVVLKDESTGRQYPVPKNKTTIGGRKIQLQSSQEVRTQEDIEAGNKKVSEAVLKSVSNKLLKSFPGSKLIINQAEWNSLTNYSEAKGFSKGNKIYINPKNATLSTPIHEFGHLWVNALKYNKTPLYKTGRELVRGTSYEEQIRSDKAYEGLSEEEILDEALVTAIGEKGAAVSNKKGFSNWLSKMWDNIKNFLGIKKNVDIATMTLSDFTKIATDEMLSGKEIVHISAINSPETANLVFKRHNNPKDAEASYKARFEADRFIRDNNQTWERLHRTALEDRYEDFMRGYQDRTRPVWRLQEDIIAWKKDEIKKIKSNKSLSPKQKSEAIANLKPVFEDLKKRLKGAGDLDVHTSMDLEFGIVAEKIDSKRDFLFGYNPAEMGQGSGMENMTRYTDALGRAVIDENSLQGRLHKEGLTLLDVGHYMAAVHAPVRNAKLRERNMDAQQDIQFDDTVAKDVPYSGLSDDQAAMFLKEIEDSGKLEVLKSAAKEIREQLVVDPLNELLEAEVINQEQYNDLLNYYGDTYVPMAVKSKADKGSISVAKKGIVTNGIKALEGSKNHDYFNRVNPIIQLLINYEQTIRRAERNKTMLRLHDLVNEQKNEEIWSTVKAVTENKIDDKTGKVVQVNESQLDIVKDFKENYGEPISVLKNGEKHYIMVRDKNFNKVFESGKGANNPLLQLAGKYINNIYGFYKRSFTGNNIDFVVGNFVRDFQDAMANVTTEQSAKIAKDVIKNIPKSAEQIRRFNKNMRGPLDERHKEYRENGGEIAFSYTIGLEESAADWSKELERVHNSKKVSVGGIALLPVRKVMRTILLANKISEGAIRFSAYNVARDNGLTPRQAASIAKNVTVNFNKQGEWNSAFKYLFLFFNPAVQGQVRKATAWKKAPIRMAKLSAASIAAKVMFMYLSDMLWDDEEDRDKMTEQDYEKNMILPVGDGKILKLPISYNYQAENAIADNLYWTMIGEKTPEQASINALTSYVANSTPFSDNYGVPFLATPFLETYINKRVFDGSPIAPERMAYDWDKKDSDMFFGSPRKISLKASEFFSNLSPANDDFAEISPNSIDYVLDFTLGGKKWILNAADNAYKSYSPDNFMEEDEGLPDGPNWNRMPVIRRFFTDIDEQTWRKSSPIFELIDVSSRRLLTDEEEKKLYRVLKNSDMQFKSKKKIKAQYKFFKKSFEQKDE